MVDVLYFVFMDKKEVDHRACNKGGSLITGHLSLILITLLFSKMKFLVQVEIKLPISRFKVKQKTKQYDKKMERHYNRVVVCLFGFCNAGYNRFIPF